MRLSWELTRNCIPSGNTDPPHTPHYNTDTARIYSTSIEYTISNTQLLRYYPGCYTCTIYEGLWQLWHYAISSFQFQLQYGPNGNAEPNTVFTLAGTAAAAWLGSPPADVDVNLRGILECNTVGNRWLLDSTWSNNSSSSSAEKWQLQTKTLNHLVQIFFLAENKNGTMYSPSSLLPQASHTATATRNTLGTNTAYSVHWRAKRRIERFLLAKSIVPRFICWWCLVFPG